VTKGQLLHTTCHINRNLIQQSINLFAGITRDVAPVSQRLEDSSQNTTVLAPLNSAIEGLPRKPWEDPRDYGELGANAYEGEDGQDRAQRNLRKFVEAHLVPSSPWPAGHKTKTVLGDREVWWEEKDGIKLVQQFDLFEWLWSILLCQLQVS
jgi:paired amphipathic helix protein Sin3a